jgi:N-acetylglucosaminyldiphosphoundecaprenol N-acetyl-beta-D-mannosaminyltransferase
MPPDDTAARREDFRTLVCVRVDSTSYQEVTRRVMSWASAGMSRYVCAANVHMVMEAYDSERFRRVVNDADVVTPDGMPLVWSLRLLGCREQQRVYGPALMLRVCEAAGNAGVPIGLYGGTDESLGGVRSFLSARFPNLSVVYGFSPPFRTLGERERQAIRADIRNSGARILFVGLGCPKQEIWMSEERGHLPVVMIGVGAAFDFHSGLVKQAPGWIQGLGMEWFFRLLMEPRRLLWRYAVHNPRFIALMSAQIIRGVIGERGPS